MAVASTEETLLLDSVCACDVKDREGRNRNWLKLTLIKKQIGLVNFSPRFDRNHKLRRNVKSGSLALWQSLGTEYLFGPNRKEHIIRGQAIQLPAKSITTAAEGG